MSLDNAELIIASYAFQKIKIGQLYKNVFR